MVRPKLNIDGQIRNMREKGIQFNIISEAEAKDILENSSYYFKIKAYARNFRKNTDNKYVDSVEFAYLYEFSKIDMYFRRNILNMGLNIEHGLKVAILRDFNTLSNNGEDIVRGFLGSRLGETTAAYLSRTRNVESISGKLIDHNPPPDMPFWVLVEVIQLGDLRQLYDYFYTRFSEFMSRNDLIMLKNMIFSAKSLRNCAAHNNCILTNIFDETGQAPNLCLNKLSPYRLQLENRLDDRLDVLLKNRYISDFLMCILLAKRIIKSNGVINHIKKDFGDFFKKICMTKKRKKYFLKNKRIRDRVCLIYRCYKNLSNL